MIQDTLTILFGNYNYYIVAVCLHYTLASSYSSFTANFVTNESWPIHKILISYHFNK